MTEKKFMLQGTQIAYIPPHTENNINHKDVLMGFVTSRSDRFIFCRFWMKNDRGFPIMELRNKANSEACKEEDLVDFISVPDGWVNQALDQIMSDMKEFEDAKKSEAS